MTVECGLCGIPDPFPLDVGYQAPFALAHGLPANHHQCCVIAVLHQGGTHCPACASARAAESVRHRRIAWAPPEFDVTESEDIDT